MHHTDVLIVGAGIVGLATAYRLTRAHPQLGVTVVDKESRPAVHQTGHNSGVLHSGIYYKPGSLKAINCRAGKKAMEAFCEAEGIDFELCGKVIVARHQAELPALERIYQRGQANGVNCQMIDRGRLAEIEPHATGVAAIHVPESGIVDYAQVCRRLAEKVVEGERSAVHYHCRVREIRTRQDGVTVATTGGDWQAKYLVNCAGLQSDRVARLTDPELDAKIIPFRGEYYQLTPDAHHLCRHLIYPVPDPNFPFLGVHFTRMIHGGVECGPNAVLAFGRECYGRFRVNLRDLADALGYRGFLKLAAHHWRMGVGEMWRSYNKKAFVRALQTLVPEIQAKHLLPREPGIRAQAVTASGQLVDDFLIAESSRVVNVCNAPSPAATASLNIGQLVVERLAARF
ncbi:MAG: L-2-hydroxyglutarate oxidase [Candidatus Competibacterales bacterium]